MAAHPTSMRKPTILVVDDDRLAADVIEMALQKRGNDVLVAHSGTEAIALIEGMLLRASVWRPVPIDLVFLDIMMPQVDGFQVCQRIKADPLMWHVPLIMLTALASLSDKLAAVQLGADGYITKPFLPEELGATVQARVEIKWRTDDLLRRIEELKAINAVTAAVSTLDAARVLSQGLTALVEHTDLAAAAMYAYDQADQLLRRAGQFGIARPQTLPVESSLAGQVFLTQQPVLTTDLAGDRVFLSDGTGSVELGVRFTVPLAGPEGSSGVLEVYHREANRFVDRDQDLYVDIGERIGVALGNAESFQRAQRSTSR